MNKLIYQVAVGPTSNLYQHCIASVADYCGKYGIQHVVQKDPVLRIKPNPFQSNRSKEAVERLGYLPIFEKENAFDLLDGNTQIAIVDADIYIRPNAPNIFDELNSGEAFAGVVERTAPISIKYRKKIANYSRMQYGMLQDVDWKWNEAGAEFYNMGLMLLNSHFNDYLDGHSAKKFLEKPEFERFVNGEGSWKWSTDQTLLNYWIKKRKVPAKQISWKWNALYKGVKDERIPEAHFVHFFLKDKLPGRGENVQELMEAIR